jgi:hypothetical protein
MYLPAIKVKEVMQVDSHWNDWSKCNWVYWWSSKNIWKDLSQDIILIAIQDLNANQALELAFLISDEIKKNSSYSKKCSQSGILKLLYKDTNL